MSLFELMGTLIFVVALFGYVNHRFIKLPEPIGTTAMGISATLVLTILSGTHPHLVVTAKEFAKALDFTDLVFHGLLGILLFAGSLHVSITDLARKKMPIIALATGGVIISTIVVGFLTHWLFAALGNPLPMVYCFLFGALISPTDPIAVMGALKSAGIPKDTELKVAGESLFNDGTAVVAFMLMLGLATGTTSPTLESISMMLLTEVGGAILYGLAAGYLAFYLIKGVDSYPLEILITLALATSGYAFAEWLHVSAPLSVVVMGLVIGNHGATAVMSPKTREHLFQFWGVMDEILNLILFGLIGLKMLALSGTHSLWFAAAAAVPAVLFARLVSVIGSLGMVRVFSPTAPHSVKVLTWGGLRGGISIALALSIPAFDGKPQIVLATYAVVLFSLLVQAPTLSPMLKYCFKRDKS